MCMIPDMIASAVVQTILLLGSGSLNVFILPGSLSVEKQLFVSSVILMVGFAQGVVLLLFKVIIRICTGIDIRFGSSYLFSPLTTAMQNAVNDRPGETAVYKDQNLSLSNVDMQAESEDGDTDTVFSHFIAEQEIVIEERRNIYTDVYLLGLAAFTATYCIDTVSPAPTTAFVSGLLIMSILQTFNILVILSRSKQTAFGGAEPIPEMHAKRILTVTSCFFATAAFVMFCTGLLGADSENKENSSVDNIFDATFSVILPLVSPWLLVTVSPKQQPLRTLLECTPFVFTICFCFVLFFLATRGEIYAILHQLNDGGARNATATDIEFHSDVNASIHFDLDFFTRTSVDSAGNIPLLLCAPLIKIPTMIVVLANVMNRSNLVVITSLLVIMSIREISNTHAQDSSHRAYCVALGLSVFALVFNVLKYLSVAPWLLAIRQPSANKKPVVEDVNLDTDIDSSL
jgi:hypothetical protein